MAKAVKGIQATLSKKQFRMVALLIFGLCFAFYGTTLTNGFALDDEIVTATNAPKDGEKNWIPNNKRVAEGISGIPKLFTTYHSKTSKSNYGYRPLVLVTFAIEFELFGVNPGVSHFINVLLYALCCCLIFYLLMRLMRDHHFILPLLITGLFLIHPLHSEVVNNIKSRDELLCLLGCFMSLLFFLRYYDGKGIWNIGLGMLFIMFALWSKATSITFLAAIPVALYFFRETSWKKLAMVTASIAAIFAVSWLIKGGLLTTPNKRNFLYFENPLFHEGELLTDKLPMAFYTIGYYIKLLILPHPLICYYGYSEVPIAGWDNIWVYVAMIIVSGAAIYGLMQLPKKGIIGFGIAFFFITISGFANLATPVVGIIGERFAFMASLGFCIVVGVLVLKLMKIDTANTKASIAKPKGLMALFGILLVLNGARVLVRNNDWKDHLTLYRHDVKKAKDSAKSHALVANTIYPHLFTMKDGPEKTAQVQETRYHYEECLRIYPDYTTSLNNLGTVLISFYGKPNEAIPLLEKAIALDTAYEEANYNLAFATEIVGDTMRAIELYERGWRINPNLYQTYPKLSSLYLQTDQPQKAITLNMEGLKGVQQVNNQNDKYRRAQHYLEMGRAYQQMADTLNHLRNIRNSLTEYPQNKELNDYMIQMAKLYMNMGNRYGMQKDTLNSLRYFEYAFVADPLNDELAFHLHSNYNNAGDTARSRWYKQRYDALQNQMR